MKWLKFHVLTAASVVALAATTATAQVNLLSNPGFEDPITRDGPPFIGSWEGFDGDGVAGTTADAANSSAMPRTGAMHLALSIVNTDNTFAGVFQDIPLAPLAPVTFSGWHKSVGPFGVGPEVRIEWRDLTSEVGRTPNHVPTISSDYTQFSLSAQAPANAIVARVVYAIQSFSGDTNTGTVYVDDTSVVIPEPSTAALLGLSGVALAALRRRRA